jgi:ribonuclease P protein component
VTRRERNNFIKPPEKSFLLPKSDILRGRERFNRLFEQPVEYLSTRHLALRYYTSGQEYACKMGFIVAKKHGKAVERNYVKRLLREAYRLHRQPLMNTLQASSTGFYGALIGKTVAIDYKMVEDETIRLLQRTVNCLQTL